MSLQRRPFHISISLRDYWFWIDHRDLPTKRALTVLMFMFTLSETKGSEELPLITIPAQ